jgi:hypothetical protein
MSEIELEVPSSGATHGLRSVVLSVADEISGTEIESREPQTKGIGATDVLEVYLLIRFGLPLVEWVVMFVSRLIHLRPNATVILDARGSTAKFTVTEDLPNMGGSLVILSNEGERVDVTSQIGEDGFADLLAKLLGNDK